MTRLPESRTFKGSVSFFEELSTLVGFRAMAAHGSVQGSAADKTHDACRMVVLNAGHGLKSEQCNSSWKRDRSCEHAASKNTYRFLQKGLSPCSCIVIEIVLGLVSCQDVGVC